MILSFNDHAANERTFLAWVRTGLSAIALGIVVKKGSFLAVVVAGAASPAISNSAQDCLGSYGGAVFVGMGIAAIGGAAVRFVRTALRIDDQVRHSAGIVRLVSSLSRRRLGASEAIEQNTRPVFAEKRTRLLHQAERLNLRLVGRIDDHEMH